MYTLITNIRFARSNGLHLEACALLICPADKNSLSNQPQLRAFGPDGAWPVFSLWLQSAEFELAPWDSQNQVILKDDGTTKPLYSGAVLRIDGHEFYLDKACHENDFLVEQFDQGNIRAVWDALPGRCARFWMAPNMPTLKWVRAEDVRRLYAEVSPR